MSELVVPGIITAESEFQGGLTGACGPNAIASAARWVEQSNAAPTTISMNQQLQHVVNSPNGVSTLEELESVMRNLHYKIVTRPTNQTAIGFVEQYGGHFPVVCFYTNAQALYDVITGDGMDANNLHGHFNTVFGKNSGGGPSPHFGGRIVNLAGFIVADGDNYRQNPLVNGVRVHRSINTDMVYYYEGTMVQAGLADAFVVIGKETPVNQIPIGWHDDGTTLTAPNSVPVVRGFRQYILTHTWDGINYPLAAEYAVTSGSIEPGNPAMGPGTRQDFRLSSLGWTSNRGVYVIWVGQDIRALESQVSALTTLVQAVKKALGVA